MIQLDTSFLIRSLVPGSEEDLVLRRWLRARETLGVSAPAWTEFQCGPVSAVAIEIAGRLLGEPLPFAEAESALAARLFNESGRRRGSLIDCLIAATAMQAGDKLATSNRADFQRLEKLGLSLA
jgi:predicted nucleic acid-binding protein